MTPPRQRPPPALLATALAAVLLVVAGCAGQDADAPSDGTAGDTVTNRPTDGPAGRDDGSMPAVAGVRVERGGGLTGSTETFRVGLGDPGAPEVLAQAASVPRDDSGEVSETPCCDIFTYTVTVQYASGQTEQFYTYDGDEGPAHQLAMAVLELTAPPAGTPPGG